jgi:Sulfotransferase family
VTAPLKRSFNATLGKLTGYEVRRIEDFDRRRDGAEQPKARPAPQPGDRLVSAPIFILCTLRSGSTLLRVLLNSHSRIHAPHEFHLRNVAVRVTSKWAGRAMLARCLDRTELEYLLWDRILHRELTRSGKEHIVVKTPNDVFNVERIVECWPDARFIFLLRHPGAIARSRASLWATVDERQNTARIKRYCEALEAARRSYPGHTVRYEELTADPIPVTQGLCEFIGVPWEEQMLEYGRFEHGEYRSGLGDWRRKIKSGRIQSAEPLPAPEEVPEALLPIAKAWGYVPLR